MVEGTHFCIPFIEKPIVYSVRTKPKEIPSLTGSKGVLREAVALRVSARITAREIRFANGARDAAIALLSCCERAARYLLSARH